MVRGDGRIVVVGAGIGGLASALDLASAGLRVLVLERAAATGGKMRTLEVGGALVDAGPTVLTMRWVFEELFAASGARLAEHVTLEPARVLARHAWPDGARLDLHADLARTAAEIEDVFGAREARAYEAFMGDARRIYQTVEAPFIRSQRPTLGSVVTQVGVLGLGALGRIDAHRTMWSAISQRFADARLRQLFGRYATYCGSSPFEAAGTLALVAWVEAEGVHRVRGGMHALRASLEALCRARGVEIRVGEHVERVLVRNGRASGVVSNGTQHDADAVVFNGDVSALGRSLVGTDGVRAVKPTPKSARSLSAVTFALVGRARGLPLVHHNVLFSDDYPAEFEALSAAAVPDAPTVYACAQDRGDEAADLADERVLLVVNAPATGDDPARWKEAERKRCEQNTFEAMRRCGLEITPRAMVQSTPIDFERMYPATGGALYGPAAKGSLSALSRQGARTRIPGLYLAGGSVHPGPGVPMAALSGRLAAQRVREDLASISPSRTADTPGTTSTG